LLCASSLCAAASDHSLPVQVSNLPAAAQSSISAALGGNTADYQIRKTNNGFEAANFHGGLTTRFTPHGVSVNCGTLHCAITVRGYGYGDALESARAVAPHASSNRVEYRRGTLTEWYINGPIGLEQGFTIAERPNKGNGQPLTVALALSEDLSALIDETRTTVRLNNRKGETLRYTGLSAQDSEGRSLKAWLQVRGQRLLLSVADAGAHYPLVIDPFIQLAELTASDAGTFDDLGFSVSISGDTVVAGDPQATVGSNSTQGAAYVFVKPATGWANMTQTAKLTASNGTKFAFFGLSVGISGDTIVAGAYENGVGSNQYEGAAYVFVKPPTGWVDMTQSAELTASDGSAGFNFANSVAISGSTIAVGSLGVDFSRGAAYVFVEPAGGWTDMTETAKLTASDSPGAYFCQSVAVFGNAVVAGAPNAAIRHGIGGAAYVFVKPVSGWANMTQTAKLTGIASFQLGWSVAISGSTILAGDPSATVAGHQDQGAVYVFVEPIDGWTDMTQTARLTASDGTSESSFGSDVSILGNIAAIVGLDTNAVYVYRRPASGWTTTSRFNAKLTPQPGTSLGASVGVDGPTVVTGGGSTAQGGTVFVFGP
jgi:FG-GAP repeat